MEVSLRLRGSSRSVLRWLCLLQITFILSLVDANARPPGPALICEAWPERPGCDGVPDCSPCHSTPPARDLFGAAIEVLLLPGQARPLSDADFAAALPAILDQLAPLDSDGDGLSNGEEIEVGRDPGQAESDEEEQMNCDESQSVSSAYSLCDYDLRHAYRKVSLDFCGERPTWSDYERFLAEGDEERRTLLHARLDQCLQSHFWLGRDGVLWQLAHSKIRPLSAIKSGADAGPIPLGDYEPDYALFAYAHSGDRDARLVLTADHFARLRQEDPPIYERVERLPEQNLSPDRRAGLISSRWFFVINTMFTPLPRTTAAQAYRAYLGLDIAKSEGLIEPIGGEPLIDYDEKGIEEEACAACHRTLDPLSYPFSRYVGIGGNFSGTYVPDRLERFGPEEGARLSQVPEAGWLLGEEVADLIEWSERAAASDAFAQKTVLDYWERLIGQGPEGASERAAFEALWRSFRDPDGHDYRVEAMLHALIEEEAYGRP